MNGIALYDYRLPFPRVAPSHSYMCLGSFAVSASHLLQASVEDLQLPAAVTISPTAPLSQALDLMLEREFSQLPVIRSSNKKLVGCISLASAKAHLENGSAQPGDPVSKWMFGFGKQGKGEKYEVITPDTSLAVLGKCGLNAESFGID